MSIEDWGWKVAESAAPDSLLQLMRCNCSSDCSSTICICSQCKGSACTNCTNALETTVKTCKANVYHVWSTLYSKMTAIRPCHTAAILSRETKRALFYHAKPRSENFGGEAWRGKTKLFWSPGAICPPCDKGEF